MKTRVWKSDWLVGLLITLVFLVFSGSDFMQGLERSAYDFSVRSTTRIPSDKIAVVAIDDESIANIGRWPWPRDIHARMHEILTEGGAKVIGQTVFFIEPQIDPGLEFISELKTVFESSSIVSIPGRIADLEKIVEDSRKLVKGKRDANGRNAINRISDYLASSPLKTSVAGEIGDYLAFLASAEVALNADLKLAESMANSSNVVLAMPFIPGTQHGAPDRYLPDYVQRNQLTEHNIVDNASSNPDRHTPVTMIDAYAPIPEAGAAASAIGALVSIPDVDGGIRSEPLLVNYYGDYYPSMALLLAAKSLNFSVEDIRAIFGNSVSLGSLNIKTDAESLMHTFFYSGRDAGRPAFPVDSFFDVLQGKVPADKYQDKVVLIGATAIGVGDNMVTPINPAMAPVLTLAHSVSSILNEDFFIQPFWALYATLGAFALVAIHLMLVLPRLGASLGFSVTATLFVAFFASEYILLTTQGAWVRLMLPNTLLVVGYLLLTTKRFLITERGKAQLHIESAENNRMLGLSLQGQGQLDMAFEKFRKLPVDDSALELLYNLALDYERKRQFNKARSVYDFIKQHDARFRDIRDRSKRAVAMEQTVILGGGKTTPGGTLVIDPGGIEKPMLGRYEIERELGKGAMGSVYLGKDPKISRVVAIKTLALSNEFAAEELQAVKERFFREAETAGRLTHPSIVTIYDAGEEQDLAYIAMEFLKGTDLTRYIKKDKLLPINRVLDLVKRTADGLDYAHSSNVVHRDVKPANIMWDPRTDSMKITDFGIARITDSSKTRTGLVMGTPSYMSPEQLAGKKIGGQSDLFSLGVMLYQLATGELPFNGDSMTSLMYQIANEKHCPASKINPNVPRCVDVVIDRALEKNPARRYKTGKQMAADIGKCRKIIAAERNGLKANVAQR
jgi:CHASE2 domain-containing sensor protein